MFNENVTFVNAELSKKEMLSAMSRADAVKLNDAVTESGFDIEDVKTVVVIHVENDLIESEDKEYDECVITAGDGTKYVTSSEPFMKKAMYYATEMKGEPDTWGLHCTKVDSKNNAGKMILCDIF